MDEGIFWIFYVIAEAIRNFFVYTPFKFMIFALLVIGGLLYFFVFKIRDNLNEVRRYYFLSYEIRRFNLQEVLGLLISFRLHNILECRSDALDR